MEIELKFTTQPKAIIRFGLVVFLSKSECI